MSASSDTVAGLDNVEVLAAVREIQASWKNQDYAVAAGQSRALLERDPGNIYALSYLTRCAIYTHDWTRVAQSAALLARRRPLEAFVAARKLSGAGHKLAAAKIFAMIDFEGDWMDEKVTELAYREGLMLLRAGEAAAAADDALSSRILWVAAARLAPRSQRALVRRNRAVLDAKKVATAYDLNQDAEGYIKAWRDVLWCKPGDIFILTRIARASESVSLEAAIDGWIEILAVHPGHDAATAKIRALTARNKLEEHAVRGLVNAAGYALDDPFVVELSKYRQAKEGEARQRQAQVALQRAKAADKEQDAEESLNAWKQVLALDPANLAAARKVIALARQLGDRASVVDGLSAIFEIKGKDEDLALRLAAAALRAGQEQRVLEQLSRLDMADLSIQHIAGLHTRVLSVCRAAIKAGDFEKAMSAFRVLELADSANPAVQLLRVAIANTAAANAKIAEKKGDLVAAVSLAEQVLQIVPDQPTALTVVARDLWRQKRFSDLVDFCQPRIKSGPEYAGIQRLLGRAEAAA